MQLPALYEYILYNELKIQHIFIPYPKKGFFYFGAIQQLKITLLHFYIIFPEQKVCLRFFLLHEKQIQFR